MRALLIKLRRRARSRGRAPDAAPPALTAIKVILWDFDGTLADSLALGLRIYNEIADRRGLVRVDDPQAARGLTTRQFLRKHKIRLWKLPAITRDFLNAQRREIAGVALYKGIGDVLGEVRRRGLQNAVVSSNSPENIRACLHANRAADQFSHLVGASKLFGKDRALRRFLKRNGLRREQVLYVGDEIRDIQAARKARVAVAAVTWGLQPREALARFRPTYLLDRPDEILDLLPR
jgi:phosphoglycolate phosphatase